MVEREELLRGVMDTFDAAAKSFDAARRLLVVIMSTEEEVEYSDGVCRHADAVEVSTLGDRGQVFVCPDCGDQFA